jgi:hypothetical protein
MPRKIHKNIVRGIYFLNMDDTQIHKWEINNNKIVDSYNTFKNLNTQNDKHLRKFKERIIYNYTHFGVNRYFPLNDIFAKVYKSSNRCKFKYLNFLKTQINVDNNIYEMRMRKIMYYNICEKTHLNMENFKVLGNLFYHLHLNKIVFSSYIDLYSLVESSIK